jgi:hypothetical protein
MSNQIDWGQLLLMSSPLWVNALWMTAWGGYIILRDRRAATWPTTNGKVVKSEVVNAPRMGGQTNRRMYEPWVEVGYRVDGKRYKTRQLQFGPTTRRSSKDDVQLEVDEYPVGRELTVTYNPNNPYDAVVHRGVSGGMKLVFWGGVGLMVMTVLMVIFFAFIGV